MGWLKFDDAAPEHPKIACCTPDSFTLWVAGLAYCSRNLTDGFVPAAIVPRLWDFDDPITAQRAADHLVRLGIWHEHDDLNGYMVHDYLDHQSSAETVIGKRAEDAERKREMRAKKASKRVSGASPSNVQADSGRCPPDVRPESALSHTHTDITLSRPPSNPRGLSTGDDDERIKPAAEIVAERRAALRPDLRSPVGWRRKVVRSLTNGDDAPELAQLAAAHPDWTAEQLADAVEPPPGQTRRKPERVDCDRCHGSGWLPETDPAQRCDHGAAA